jgi:hypothetical protein
VAKCLYLVKSSLLSIGQMIGLFYKANEDKIYPRLGSMVGNRDEGH